MQMDGLIRRVAEKANITHRAAEIAIVAAFEAIAETMISGDRVCVTNFGIFEAKRRSERLGRNPHTGEAVYIPERVVPGFKPLKPLRDKISQEFGSPRKEAK